MSCCTIFNKNFVTDITDINNVSISISFVKDLIPAYNAETSGLWRPIIIDSMHSRTSYSDLLSEPETDIGNEIDPCNCNPNFINDIVESAQNVNINCNYCADTYPANHTATAKLQDTDGNFYMTPPYFSYPVSAVANCCQGACDTRMLRDDYLPKIPFLNQKYLKTFHDFKYKKQFPAVTNPGLGCEFFVTTETSNLNSFDTGGPSFGIDWLIKDRISEIPYDPITSQYNNETDHEKAYSRSLHTSSTCGNFIFTSSSRISGSNQPYYSILEQNNVSTLPTNDEFQKIPHGFSSSTYNNIFVGDKKICSNWKWNYSSGILCWYRYYDINRTNDIRPIPQVDLYIPSGDVFYATNDGPEPYTVVSEDADGDFIKSCPSGLKVIQGSEISAVIPSGSSFTYISANLYPHFLDIHQRLSQTPESTLLTDYQKFNLASLLCTAPQYDNITVDLLKRNILYQYGINQYGQIDILDKHMSTLGIGSDNELNYIKDNKSLILTLANKYGSYLLFEPNTMNQTLTVSDDIDEGTQFYVDLDYDMCIPFHLTTGASSNNCDRFDDCTAPEPLRRFTYDQTVAIGSSLYLSSLIYRDGIYYNQRCSNNTLVYDPRTAVKLANLNFHGGYIGSEVYSSGCVVLQDSYPRIMLEDTTAYCINCTSPEYSRFSSYNDFSRPDGAENSSYKLFIKSHLNNSENLCWYYQNDNSFCDYSLGRFYNNSEIGDVYGSRPLRAIKDGSLYLKRSYNAVIFDPRIEKVAFHHQGGLYFSSKNFNAISGSTIFGARQTIPNDKIRITFNTEDVGIKLYGLKIEKLRSNNASTSSCLSFPTKDACKCYPLIKPPVYTNVCSSSSSSDRVIYETNPILSVPGLSTTYSPTFYSYGGYTDDQLKDMFGEGYEIPGHPNAGQRITALDRFVDPVYPYGCERKASISLPNYVNSSWQVYPPNFSTYHSDIWATVSENIDLFRPLNYVEIADDQENFEEQMVANNGYRRFATKITINNVDVYDQQSTVVYSQGTPFSNDSPLSVNLENPYLKELLGGIPHNLYPGSGYACTSNSININVYGSRGDESVLVPITLSCIPRKQILNFAIRKPNPVGMGTLKRGFFHPNSGLIYDYKTDESPITRRDNKLYIDYDKRPFSDDESETDYNTDRFVLIGDFNKTIKRTLSKIDDFDSKKLKLYLYINGKWYEYAKDHSLGFIKNNNTYIGDPFFFEYSSNDSASKIKGPVIPVSAKTNMPFDFVYNYVPIRNQQKSIYSNNYNYLLNNLTYKKLTNEYIAIEGTRAYFALTEQDFAIYVPIDKISEIPEMPEDTYAILESLRQNRNPIEIILNNGKRYRYKYRPTDAIDNKQSYYECKYNDLYTNYTERTKAFDINNVNNLYYVINSIKSCFQYITLRSKTSEKIVRTKIVTNKAIFALQTDEYGNLSAIDNSTIKKYIRTYTVLRLSSPLQDPYDPAEGYLDLTGLSSSSNKYGADSFTIFSSNFNVKKENDRNLSNPFYISKWGDLIGYDGQIINDLSKYIYNQYYLSNNYPSTTYNNFFYKAIVNDGDINHYLCMISNFDSEDPSNKIKLNYYGKKSFLIHQRYNIGLNDYKNSNYYEQYHNYLPFMDINFTPSVGSTNTSIRQSINQYLPSTPTGNIFSGIFTISGIYKNIDEYSTNLNFFDPGAGEKFWIDYVSANLKPALTIYSDIFYSNTLRIDDSPYKLSNITYSSNYTSQNLRAVFLPSFVAPTTPPTQYLDFSHFTRESPTGNIFARFPIYGDTDKVSGCSVTCGINTVGNTAFVSTYNLYSPGAGGIDIGDNIPFIVSNDNGFYNVLGNNKIHYIQRIELDPVNELFPTNNCDGSISPLPLAIKNSCLNDKYQYILSDNLLRNNSHSTIVNNTDIFANEMLFRMLYGEKQKINLNVLDGYTKPLEFKDLMSYVYPKTEAKDVYKNIPYDLDVESQTSVAVSGNISIKGSCNIGDSVTITIGSKNIVISISRSDSNIMMGVNTSDGSFSRKIYTERIENIGYFASLNSSLTGPNITNLNTSCRQPRVVQIGAAATFLNATVTTPKPDGTFETVTFPYWKDDGSDCPDVRYYNGPEHPYIAFEHNPGCAPNVLPFTRCTNRCTVRSIDVINDNPNCYLVTLSQGNVNVNGYARGVFSQGCVDVGGVTNLNFVDDTGCVDDIPNARITMDAGGVGSIVTGNGTPCGTCYTLDYVDPVSGRNYFTPFLPTGNAKDSCECRNWEYGYCRNNNNASACVCNALTYDYTDIDYTFGYCRYNIALKGFKRKLIYPQNLQQTTYGLPSCNSAGNTGYPPGNGPSVSNVKEWCGGIICTLQPERYWHVYKTSNPVQYPLYSGAACHDRNFCNIIYNNNSINIYIGNTTPICIKNTLNGCPYLKVDMPPNYTVTDNITSNCSDCLYSDNKITIHDTPINFEYVIETRTCVLGTTQLGGGELVIGMNRQVRGCAQCGNCDPNKCRTEVPVAGAGVCGQSAPASFPTKYCISYGGAAACGNSLYGCDVQIDNSALLNLAYPDWLDSVTIAYANSAPCFSNTSISTDDIVEGIIPGSCSSMQITNVTIPVVTYRTTLSHNVEVGSGGIVVAIAYYTYSYKRRKTIQDILIDNSNCYTQHPSCQGSPPYLREKYRTDCNSSLSCYNNNELPLCGIEDNRYCCKAGKNESI